MALENRIAKLESAKSGEQAGRDLKTGRFVKGNTLGDLGTRGRKPAEFTIQDILDAKLPEARWWTDVLEPQVLKAAKGDTPAAALLLKARWGENFGIRLSGADGGPLAIIVQSLIPRPEGIPSAAVEAE